MTIPSLNFKFLQNGIGFNQVNSGNCLVLAPSTSLTLGEITQVSSPVKANTLYGYTPLAQATGFLSAFSQNVYALPLPATLTTLTNQALTTTAGTALTVSGSAVHDFDLAVTVSGTGATQKFSFSLDGGITVSAPRTLASGAFTIPNSGLTLTFSGTYLDGYSYSYSPVGPKLSGTDFTAAFAKILNDSRTFDYIVVYDGLTATALGSTRFGLLSTQMSFLESKNYYTRAIMDFGSSETSKTAAITALGSLVDHRISVCDDSTKTTSALSFEGFSVQKSGLILPVAANVISGLLSQDPGEVARGPLPNVYSIEADQKVSDSGLDQVKAITAYKLRGFTGFYATYAHLKSTTGSDYKKIQHGRIMDMASAIAYAVQGLFINMPVKVNADGTIDEADAKKMESKVNSVLKSALLDPINSAGSKGHVSAVKYQIDTTTNVRDTETITATVKVNPLGYASTISTTLSFSGIQTA